MTLMPRVNPLWQHITETHINPDSTSDLTNFKREEVNYRLTYFDVRTNGVRYLKTLVFNLAAALGEENWARLRRIRNREVGNPYTVTYDGEQVCLDYLRAVLDLDFLTRNFSPDGSRVLEIGAGYGRTCHTMMSNHDIAEYRIIDLPNTLQISRKYLETVLPKAQFTKISFIPIDELDRFRAEIPFDLCINIDSLAEMDMDTVRFYLSFIDRHCGHFYVNNPVGKYMDKSLDGHARGEDAIARAMSPGPLTDVIDINDNRAVRAQAGKFTTAYRPGGNWDCVADAWAAPYTWYWHALYRKR
ncbi:putative sugar O-methyltransferase [Streptomyces sp. YIM 98790]|uniref:putative sugar O-methyltransferase n=1 Tax=Streptomyces sp. YIM 98790 TaxID=2689077 RepID=UPI00140BB90C|nr:putative sugar O-methyltransferase [Streptomyces sp. YIM 98790]